MQPLLIETYQYSVVVSQYKYRPIGGCQEISPFVEHGAIIVAIAADKLVQYAPVASDRVFHF